MNFPDVDVIPIVVVDVVVVVDSVVIGVVIDVGDFVGVITEVDLERGESSNEDTKEVDGSGVDEEDKMVVLAALMGSMGTMALLVE